MSKRLLALNNYFYRRGGTESVMFGHDALFRSKGWETAFFAMTHPKNERSEWEKYFVSEIEFGHSYGLLKKIGMVPKIIYSHEARRNLSALLESFKPDVAHIHSVYHHLSPSVLPLLADRGVPVVLTAHDFKLLCPAYKMLNRSGICERCHGGRLWNVVTNQCIQGSLPLSALIAIESIIHHVLDTYRKNVARIIAPSVFLQKKFAEWGWRPEHVTYVPNFIQAEAYEPQFEPGDYLLYFGRLAPEKGLKTLIRAVLTAGVPLRVVGSGPSEAELREVAKDSKNVQFLGYMSGGKLREVVQGARAVVLPAEWYENSPMSILEAYALGKPVIGAKIGGIGEMIVDGETGLLFQSASEAELVDAIVRIMTTPKIELAAMGRAGRVLVETRFSESRYFQSVLGVYREVGVSVA
jgi:glycosyltransferase involved in cell wall biosynthesis